MFISVSYLVFCKICHDIYLSIDENIQCYSIKALCKFSAKRVKGRSLVFS